MPSDVLALRCEFLNGTYQAAAPGRIGDPEWPPHPARLHAALVAAGWALGDQTFPADARAALNWLERLPAPSLAYPSSIGSRGTPGVFVPRNLTGQETRDVLGAMRSGRDTSRLSGRVPRSFPTSIVGDQPVWFIWSADEPTHRAALTRLAREVQYLGSSRSPICCDVAEGPPDPVLVPGGGTHGTALRVAQAGFTDQLLAARGLHPPPTHGASQPYRPAATPTMEAEVLAGSPFEDLVVRAFDPIFPLTILHTPLIARAFREAVLARAGDDAPPVLHGHWCNPHVAFVPLANVGHDHASGEIFGVATAIPKDVSTDDRNEIVQAVNGVEQLHNLGVGGPWRLRPGAERSVRTLAVSRWVRPAHRWQSVTPVILDRYPKRRSREAFEKALRDTFAHAGAPSPAVLEVSSLPWQAAAVPAPAYTGQSLPDGLRVHVDVTFSEPVRGPLLVGRGRYFGVGLFAPVSAQDTRPDDDAGA
jgi:CRISPR-associated protein Csb2